MIFFRTSFRILFPLVLWLATAAGLRAHDVGLSTATLRVEADRFEMTAEFALADADHLVNSPTRAASKSAENNAAVSRAALEAAAPGWWRVTADTAPLPATNAQVAREPGDFVKVLLRFSRPAGAHRLEFSFARFAALPGTHRQVVTVLGPQGQVVYKELLDAGRPALTVELPSAASVARAATETGGATFWGFLRLGVEHIGTGYDHLLFLVALLLVVPNFRAALVIISSFTVAHSLTLLAATLNWVHLSPRFSEPAIAVTILFVGLENLWTRGQAPRGRWIVTFFFGLIHGFGFANVLRDLGVGLDGRGIGLPLLAFNCGVELGQLVIAALVLPLVWRCRRSEKFTQRVVPVLSILIALLGLAWLVQRLAGR